VSDVALLAERRRPLTPDRAAKPAVCLRGGVRHGISRTEWRRPLTPDGAAKPDGVPAAVVSDVAFPRRSG
jgi:hypothetical protein